MTTQGSQYPKGSVVETLNPSIAVPLGTVDGLTLQDRHHMPDFPGDSAVEEQSQEQCPHLSIALHLAKNERGLVKRICQKEDQEEYEEELQPIYAKAKQWKDQSSLSEAEWKQLVVFVHQKTIILSDTHLLATYTSKTIHQLSDAKLEELRTYLSSRNEKLQKVPTSRIGVATYINDTIKPPSLGILFNEAVPLPQHSCFPTAVLEINESHQVNIVALHDIDADANVSVCYIDDDASVEERDGNFRVRFGFSCTCFRCRYEMNEFPVDTTNANDSFRLANYYFSHGQEERAAGIYKQLTKTSLSNEAKHALAAIQLGKGKFLEAQRLWNELASGMNGSFVVNEGIATQTMKLRAYRYLEDDVFPDADQSTLKYTSHLPLVFHYERFLDQTTCTQVIAWAESGTWTQSRHYAVPTHDVPVHTVPKLLKWWNDVFSKQIRPLLAKQFGTSSHFYCHDAFCVRYDASKAANHLPVHTDESTHSLVIGLSGNFEGGGTYFYDADVCMRTNVGGMLSFRGDSTRHGGEAVTEGTRYILAAFLYLEPTLLLEPSSPVLKKTRHTFDFQV